WVFNDEPEAPEAASQSPGQALPSPDYVPSPEHPPSLDFIPEPEYPKYLIPSDDEVPIEDQPLPVDALPTSLSSGYVANSDPEENPEEDPVDYPADGGDDDDEDDDDDDDEKEESSEDDANDEEENERLAPADSFVTPMATATKVLIAAVAVALPSSSPPPSPLTLLLSPLPQIPSPPLPLPSPPLPLPSPSSPLLLPATDHMEDVPEADVPPQKRLCLTAPTPGFEVGESSAVVATRQPGLDFTHATDYSFVDTMDATPGRPMSREVGYGITDVWDDMVGDMEERDDRALQRARVNMLFRDRRYHLHTAMLLESEARHTRQAWSQAIDCNRAVHAELLAYRAEGHDRTREPEPARDPEPQDGPADAGSSC
ncbi:hypothetical protein Tco_0257866, partial [Tanacetum coccineum]